MGAKKKEQYCTVVEEEKRREPFVTSNFPNFPTSVDLSVTSAHRKLRPSNSDFCR